MKDNAPAFNNPAPRRAVRAHVRGAARACATPPITAVGAPRANVGARSASAPFVAGNRRAGQLNVSGSVSEKRAPLLNALGSSLTTGQKRARLELYGVHERGRRTLRATERSEVHAVHARVVLAERRRSRKRGGETQRPRSSLPEAAVY